MRMRKSLLIATTALVLPMAACAYPSGQGGYDGSGTSYYGNSSYSPRYGLGSNRSWHNNNASEEGGEDGGEEGGWNHNEEGGDNDEGGEEGGSHSGNEGGWNNEEGGQQSGEEGGNESGWNNEEGGDEGGERGSKKSSVRTDGQPNAQGQYNVAAPFRDTSAGQTMSK